MSATKPTRRFFDVCMRSFVYIIIILLLLSGNIDVPGWAEDRTDPKEEIVMIGLNHFWRKR